jgi:phosphatidylcholine synthase
MLLSSAYGFAHAGAKIERGSDHFFTGFPSYWNIVAVYLYVLRLPQQVNAMILVALSVAVFVPIRYVYPSRTRTLMVPTLVLGSTWAALFTWVIFRLPDTSGPWTMLSLAFPIYYVGLSLWLHGRETSV